MPFLDVEYTLYGFYGVLAIVFLLYFVPIFMKWRVSLQVLIGISEIIIFVLTVFSTTSSNRDDISLDTCIGSVRFFGARKTLSVGFI